MHNADGDGMDQEKAHNAHAMPPPPRLSVEPEKPSSAGSGGFLSTIFCCCSQDSAAYENNGSVRARRVATPAEIVPGAITSPPRPFYTAGTNQRDSASIQMRHEDEKKISQDDDEEDEEEKTEPPHQQDTHSPAVVIMSAAEKPDSDDGTRLSVPGSRRSSTSSSSTRDRSPEELDRDSSLVAHEVPFRDSFERERMGETYAEAADGKDEIHVPVSSVTIAAAVASADPDHVEPPSFATPATSSGEESIIHGRAEIYHPLQPDQLTEFGPATPTDKGVRPPMSLLAPIREELVGRKCLVLDLDETLVHSSFKYLQQADFVIPVEIEGQYHNVYVIKRPGVDEFMRRVGEIYEIVVFTASVSKYGDPLLDQLDIHKVVHHRLFRESCYNHQGNYVKDLSQIGRPLGDIIILDNSPASYVFHPQHAVPISSWFSDAHDNELLDLVPFLEDLGSSNVRDVSLVLDVNIPPHTPELDEVAVS